MVWNDDALEDAVVGKEVGPVLMLETCEGGGKFVKLYSITATYLIHEP